MAIARYHNYATKLANAYDEYYKQRGEEPNTFFCSAWLSVKLEDEGLLDRIGYNTFLVYGHMKCKLMLTDKKYYFARVGL